MANLSRTITTYSDGSYALDIYEPPSPLPDPVILPACLVVGAEHNGEIWRLNHDDVPRLPGMQTNEISVFRPLRADGLKPDPHSKVDVKINFVWCEEFYRLNNPWIAEWLFGLAVGWFDLGYPNYNMMGTGGNIGRKPGNALEFVGYYEEDVQDFAQSPYGLDYLEHPDKVIKQTLVTGTTSTIVITDRKRGDVYLPKVAAEHVFISKVKRDNNEQGVTLFPDLPCQTELNGVPVTVTSWAFHGSDTYCQVDGLWYLAEEMQITGAGHMSDRRTYCKALEAMPCPPPVAGWTKE